MKKILSILSSIAVLTSCGMSTLMANAEDSTNVKTEVTIGDINEDGAVDYKDAVLNLKYYSAA